MVSVDSAKHAIDTSEIPMAGGVAAAAKQRRQNMISQHNFENQQLKKIKSRYIPDNLITPRRRYQTENYNSFGYYNDNRNVMSKMSGPKILFEKPSDRREQLSPKYQPQYNENGPSMQVLERLGLEKGMKVIETVPTITNVQQTAQVKHSLLLSPRMNRSLLKPNPRMSPRSRPLNSAREDAAEKTPMPPPTNDMQKSPRIASIRDSRKAIEYSSSESDDGYKIPTIETKTENKKKVSMEKLDNKQNNNQALQKSRKSSRSNREHKSRKSSRSNKKTSQKKNENVKNTENKPIIINDDSSYSYSDGYNYYSDSENNEKHSSSASYYSQKDEPPSDISHKSYSSYNSDASTGYNDQNFDDDFESFGASGKMRKSTKLNSSSDPNKDNKQSEDMYNLELISPVKINFVNHNDQKIDQSTVNLQKEQDLDKTNTLKDYHDESSNTLSKNEKLKEQMLVQNQSSSDSSKSLSHNLSEVEAILKIESESSKHLSTSSEHLSSQASRSSKSSNKIITKKDTISNSQSARSNKMPNYIVSQDETKYESQSSKSSKVTNKSTSQSNTQNESQTSKSSNSKYQSSHSDNGFELSSESFQGERRESIEDDFLSTHTTNADENEFEEEVNEKKDEFEFEEEVSESEEENTKIQHENDEFLFEEDVLEKDNKPTNATSESSDSMFDEFSDQGDFQNTDDAFEDISSSSSSKSKKSNISQDSNSLSLSNIIKPANKSLLANVNMNSSSSYEQPLSLTDMKRESTSRKSNFSQKSGSSIFDYLEKQINSPITSSSSRSNRPSPRQISTQEEIHYMKNDENKDEEIKINSHYDSIDDFVLDDSDSKSKSKSNTIKNNKSNKTSSNGNIDSSSVSDEKPLLPDIFRRVNDHINEKSESSIQIDISDTDEKEEKLENISNSDKGFSQPTLLNEKNSKKNSDNSMNFILKRKSNFLFEEEDDSEINSKKQAKGNAFNSSSRSEDFFMISDDEKSHDKKKDTHTTEQNQLNNIVGKGRSLFDVEINDDEAYQEHILGGKFSLDSILPSIAHPKHSSVLLDEFSSQSESGKRTFSEGLDAKINESLDQTKESKDKPSQNASPAKNAPEASELDDDQESSFLI